MLAVLSTWSYLNDIGQQHAREEVFTYANKQLNGHDKKKTAKQLRHVWVRQVAEYDRWH